MTQLHVLLFSAALGVVVSEARAFLWYEICQGLQSHCEGHSPRLFSGLSEFMFKRLCRGLFCFDVFVSGGVASVVYMTSLCHVLFLGIFTTKRSCTKDLVCCDLKSRNNNGVDVVSILSGVDDSLLETDPSLQCTDCRLCFSGLIIKGI